MELIFCTHNENKVIEINKLLPDEFQLIGLSDFGFSDEIKETGSTLEENALIKVRTIYNSYKKNCFADDSGLEVDALKGKPGVYSARYAGNQKNANDNISKLLEELKEIDDRKARFRTVIALILDGKEYLFEGIAKGEISRSPIGKNGFGYDPIFIPENQKLSFAQLTLLEKNKISHRSLAFQKLLEFLKANKSI
jgi:XTP/dITP diphosphohydrolase